MTEEINWMMKKDHSTVVRFYRGMICLIVHNELN